MARKKNYPIMKRTGSLKINFTYNESWSKRQKVQYKKEFKEKTSTNLGPLKKKVRVG